MKAFAIDCYGGPEALTLRDLPEPGPGAGQLLIGMRAASINPVDFKIRSGGLKVLVKDRFPLVLGSDVSGRRRTRRAWSHRLRARRRGLRASAQGLHRRLCRRLLLDAALAARKPSNLSHAEPASIPLVGETVFQALVEVGKPAKGQRVLVHAGSGGVGTFAIQLARHLGATVATTAGAKNRALVEELGASEIVDYRRQRFEDVIAPCDVVLDTQGGETLERSFRVVKEGGVVVTIGGKPDGKFAKAYGLSPLVVFALGIMMRKVTRLARERRARFEYLFMRPDGEQLAQIAALLERGVIRPVLDRTFPFARTKEAMAYVEAGRAVGKVVVVRPSWTA